MDMGDRLLHRAYVLVEAEIPSGDAIEDLVTLAHGNVENLRCARARASSGFAGSVEADATALELAGFEPRLLQVASARRAALGNLLDRAIASFG
jgi:hypothetical protein